MSIDVNDPSWPTSVVERVMGYSPDKAFIVGFLVCLVSTPESRREFLQDLGPKFEPFVTVASTAIADSTSGADQ
jgi:hypothetical protein